VDKRELLSAIKRVPSRSFKRLIIIECTGVLTSAVKNLTDFYERGGGSITGPTFFAEMK
jgi:hypothetical protein